MTPSQQLKHDPLCGSQACIVWHPLSTPPAQDLLRALTNKGMTLIDADSAHTAFAAVNHASRSARRTILVLDTRETLHDVDRVISALERFAPQALCWAHIPGANPPLVPLVQREASKPKKSTQVETELPPAPLRLVGQPEAPETEPAPPSPTPAPTRAAPISSRDVLDADELDALLSNEMGDRPT